MKFLLSRSVVSLLLAAALGSCRNGNSTDVGDGMTFAWQNSLDYTNIYRGEGTEPVIPGGCDSAKWNRNYILTKGEYWRYRVRKQEFGIVRPPADSLVYFILDKKRYAGRQELDPALHGPLTRTEQLEWEQRIPGPYQVPE